MRRVLEGRFEVIDEAENGLDAVRMCLAACHNECPYHLVMMDSHMPVMNGLEASRSMKAHQKSIKIIGVTGNASKSDIDSFLEAGADKVMVKPLNLDELFDFLIDANVPNDQNYTEF